MDPPPGALPQFDMNSLLPDLLQAIVVLIPLRARLRAVSPVCKKWRTAVLCSVTRPPAVAQKNLANLVSLFPNVESIGVNQAQLTTIAPLTANLRSIYLNMSSYCCSGGKASLECPSDAFDGFSNLIELAFSVNVGCKHGVPLLQRVQSSLRSLRLEEPIAQDDISDASESEVDADKLAVVGKRKLSVRAPTPLAAYLTTAYFPCLTELFLPLASDTASRAFIDRHSSQLVTLMICNAKPSCKFPSLRCLDIAKSSNNLDLVMALIKSAPKLENFKFGCSEQLLMPEYVALIAPIVTNFTLEGGLDDGMEMVQLSKIASFIAVSTRLRSLNLDSVPIRSLISHLSHLRELWISTPDDVTGCLFIGQSFPCLESVTIMLAGDASMAAHSLPTQPPHLPALRRFRWLLNVEPEADEDLPIVVGLATMVVEHCPRLEVLDLDVPKRSSHTDAHVVALRKLIDLAKAKGLLEVQVTIASRKFLELRSGHSDCLWTRVVVSKDSYLDLIFPMLSDDSEDNSDDFTSNEDELEPTMNGLFRNRLLAIGSDEELPDSDECKTATMASAPEALRFPDSNLRSRLLGAMLAEASDGDDEEEIEANHQPRRHFPLPSMFRRHRRLGELSSEDDGDDDEVTELILSDLRQGDGAGHGHSHGAPSGARGGRGGPRVP